MGGSVSMKILVMPKPIEGASREEMLRHATAEIQAAWELYKQGVVREFYAHTDEPNRVVLMLESAGAEAARDALSLLPFVQLHLIDFDIIPLAPFYGLEHLPAVRS
jgi:hypothetical protein